MNDYNQYVTAVNKIFDYLAKLKAGWKSKDNDNYQDKIEEFRNAVISNADRFKQPASVGVQNPVPQTMNQQPTNDVSQEQQNTQEITSFTQNESITSDPYTNSNGDLQYIDRKDAQSVVVNAPIPSVNMNNIDENIETPDTKEGQ